MQDAEKKSPDDFKGLKEFNYILIMPKEMEPIYHMTEKVKASGIRYEYARSYQDLRNKRNVNKKLVVIEPRLPITYRQKLEFIHKLIEYPVKFIDDDFLVLFKGLTMFKNDILYKTFRDGIQRLFEAGITNIFTGKNFHEINEKNFEIFDRDNHDDVALTLRLLDAGFIIWLGCIAVSILVLFGELIIFRLMKRKNRVHLI